MSNNVFFHETFQPEMNYISKILELSQKEYSGDKYQISELTGIPTGKEKGKVEPHIKYAKYMGLIDYTCNHGVCSLSLSKLGAEVWRQDKYLHEPLTLWLLHYGLSRDEYGAPQWAWIVRTVHPGFIEDVSGSRISSLAQKEFDISSAEVTKAISVVKSSYMSGCFLATHYLEWDDSIKYSEKTEQIEFLYLYAYALLDMWDLMFPGKKEITFADIVDTLKFGKVFGLNDEDVDSVLSSLEENGVLRLNRQLFPITIVRTFDKGSAIESLYSMLM